jgi:hypothetical protein
MVVDLIIVVVDVEVHIEENIRFVALANMKKG